MRGARGNPSPPNFQCYGQCGGTQHTPLTQATSPEASQQLWPQANIPGGHFFPREVIWLGGSIPEIPATAKRLNAPAAPLLAIIRRKSRRGEVDASALANLSKRSS